MASWLRRIVSGQKKRFQDDGFDLDLAYISPRIIAMGLPADAGKELLFRNPMPEIARFLRHYHRGHAKVYNLCSEHTYSQDKLLVALQHYPFDDHQTPALVVVQQFCADAAAWLAADSRNVVVVHCKAGKGRTGIMICCLLLYLHLNAPHLANLELAAAAAAGQPSGGCDEGDAAHSDSSSSSSLASIDNSGGRGSQGWHPWQSVEPVQLSRLASPARDVLALYAERRTHDGNGVTIASQRRYVAYFWRVLALGPRPCGSLPARRTLQLRQLVISGLPPGVADSCVVAVEARPSGSTAASATRVLVVPGPRALSSGMAGVCLAPCVLQPLVRDDGCRIAIASSATAGDTLTLTMPAASMGLSELSSRQQQQQATPGCCGACSCGASCLGAGARLSPAAVAPAAAAEGGAVADAAAAYGLAGEWVPAVGCPAAVALDQDASEAAGDQQQGCCVVEGDVRILVLRGGSRLFYTWFNTGLLPPGNCYSLTRAQLDKPAKGMPEQLQLTVRFVDLKPHADEEDDELPGGTRPGQQQQQPDDGTGTPGTPRLLPPGASGWVGLGKRLLTTSSHKRPAEGGARGGKHSGRGGGVSQGRPAAAAPPEVLAGAEPCGGGASASKRAKRAAPLVLTGSSSSSALAAMGQQQQQQQQPAQRQPVQGSVSAPASPHSVGKLPAGKLSRSSSWKWQQHLPAISSISGSLWDWAGAAGSVAEDGEGEASAASFGGLQPQSRLSWDWDWPSLAAPAAAQQAVFDGLAAAGPPPAALPALASAISAPALLDASARSAPLAAPGGAAGKRSSGSGVSGRYRSIQQDLHTSGLSRSPAAIELPCLRRMPGASATVDALLDPPAVALAASPQLRSQQQQAGAASCGGSGGARKRGPSLWQLLLREPAGGRAGLLPGSAARRAAGAAAAAAEGGDKDDGDDDDGGDTYPVADVLARPGDAYSRRLLRADGSASAAGGAAANGSGGGPAAGSGDSLQGLLDALNWSTDTWRPVGATAAGGAGAGSSWQQPQRRHTYSGPRGIHGSSKGTSSCSSSPVARRQAMKKVHSAPNTPPGLASLSGDHQPEQQWASEGWAAAAAAVPGAQQLTSRLLDLDLEGAYEPSSSLAAAAAHSSAAQPPCCVDCMFGLHTSPCPAATSSAATAASSAAAVALMSAAAAGGGGGGGTSPLQSVRSCPLQPAGSTCDADVRVTTIPCNRSGGGGGGKRGGLRGRRGEASEQLQALLAAAGDEWDDAGSPAAPPGDLGSSGEPDVLSLTQQWKQLEKAWQRSWCV